MSEPVKDELLVAKENKEEGDKEEKKINLIRINSNYILYQKCYHMKAF